MDYDRQGPHHYVNGMSAPRQNEKKKEHNYKLVVDPFLHKGHPQKIYRFDGVMPGENRVVSTRDPRSRITRLWTRQQQADLPLPKFKYDEYYVGIPPPKDVTFTNLNDNINKDFLENMCKGCGKIEECKIYFHPKTRKHLGIGKTLFTSSKAARACVEKLNQTSKMGNIINVFIDTMGKERNRLIEELTTEQVKNQPSPERRSSSLSDSNFPVPETEAYDPSDAFGEMGHLPEVEYTPSVETDYSSYSVPQSEMSYSSQDTGYSSSANNASYHRDNYNQYPIEGSHNSQHGGNNYYPRHQGHYRENHQHHPSRHGHRSGHIVHHQPPSTPAHRHTPQPTPHYSNRDMDNSHYGSFYAPPPPIPKPMFDRPPPPLPPEPPRNRRSDYEDQHDRPSKHRDRKKKNKEPKPPPRPPSPEPPSEGPRLESLESRIQSLLCSNSHGMGSPEHTSSSSQDESTPAHLKTEAPSFEFYPPPATQPLPPLPELGVDEPEASPRETHPPRPVSSQGDAEFESEVLDSQTVVEETVDICATPSTECVPNGKAAPRTDHVRASKREDKGNEDEDDRMSLSSISSNEEKMEINPPLPPSSSATSTPTKANFTQSPQAASTSTASTVPVSWPSNIMTSPFSSPPPGYQPRLYNDQSPQKLEEEDPNYHTFTTVLDKFVKELKQILQKDLCKKMVENSAFKSFESWWDGEVIKSKKSQLAEKGTEVVPSASTAVKVKSEKIKPELSSSLASLFESRDSGNMESSGMGYGGFLGIRGGMPKLPSFKRKFPRPSQVIEEDEDSRKTGAKSAEEEESDDEVLRSSKQKAVISDSEESDDSSDEEKEDISADEDEEGSEESSEEEEESDESEEESSESEDSDGQEEEDEVEQTQEKVTAKEDISQEKPENSRVEEKMEVEDDSEDEEVDVGTETEASFNQPEAQEKEDSDVDVSSMDTDESVAESSEKEKESPEKRPLSPILEEREKEEQTENIEDNSKSAQDTTASTETSASSAVSSAMDSDSSALETLSPIKKPVPIKRGKGRGSSSSASSKAPSSAVESAESDSVDVTSDPAQHGHDTVVAEEEVNDSETSHKLSESEAEQRSHFMVPAIAEHDYFSFPPASAPEESTVDSDRTESADEESETLSEVLVDHNYSLPPIVEEVRIGKAILKKESVISPKPAKETKKRVRAKKSKNNMLADITNRTEDKVSRELANLLTPATPVKQLKPLKTRTFQEERQIFFDIYDKGISEEDVRYLKRSYDELIQSDDPNFYWLNDILWVDHTHTDIKDVLPVPPKKKKKVEDHVPKPHPTGCARTEGYYKLTMNEKAGYLRHAHNLQLQQKAAEDLRKVQEGKKAQSSREARHHNRRLQTTYSDLETDLLRFNQLKFRRKQLKFAKSGIHDWGLFALEPIASEEMVIEYVGQVVRQSIADERERRYEAIGIGSSYLFRVDTETIIDATMTGNLARFINHSCNPNCYAKIITVEAEKKIVIYSKRDIDVNEEITYDYKFPIEDEKIPCLCMSTGCRGTLN